jgi:hypothetical protein
MTPTKPKPSRRAILLSVDDVRDDAPLCDVTDQTRSPHDGKS